MSLSWTANPAFEYALLAAGILLSLFLFVTLKWESWTAGRRAAKKQHDLGRAVQSLHSEIEQLRDNLRSAEERAGMLVVPTPPRSGMNLNARTQALRMLRRGETPASVASSLGLPAGEVDLLIKVHRIVLEQVS